MVPSVTHYSMLEIRRTKGTPCTPASEPSKTEEVVCKKFPQSQQPSCCSCCCNKQPSSNIIKQKSTASPTRFPVESGSGFLAHPSCHPKEYRRRRRLLLRSSSTTCLWTWGRFHRVWMEGPWRIPSGQRPGARREHLPRHFLSCPSFP